MAVNSFSPPNTCLIGHIIKNKVDYLSIKPSKKMAKNNKK